MIVHYTQSYKALNRYIDVYNAGTGVKLRSAVVLTIRELIRIYGAYLRKEPTLDIDYLPPLKTNNRQLAKLIKCSTRTIPRHLDKLMQSGLILKKKFKGTRANYELWLLPTILFPTGEWAVDKYPNSLQQLLQKAAEPLKKTSDKTTKCPLSDYNKNNLLITVEKWKTPENEKKSLCLPLQRGNLSAIGQLLVRAGYVAVNNKKNIQGNTREIDPTFFEKKLQEANEGCETREIDRGAGLEVSFFPPISPAPGNSHKLYSDFLWDMASNLLYRDKDLVQAEIKRGKLAIQKLYEPVEEKKLQQVHQIYAARIELVRQYVQRKPAERFVPIPSVYFNTENPNGFVGTKKWYQAHRQRKKEVAMELSLSRQLRRYRDNEQSDATKRKPPLQLYRECEEQLKKWNEPELLRRFHEDVLQMESTKNKTHYAHTHHSSQQTQYHARPL